MQFWFSIYALQHILFFWNRLGFAFEVNIDV